MWGRADPGEHDEPYEGVILVAVVIGHGPARHVVGRPAARKHGMLAGSGLVLAAAIGATLLATLVLSGDSASHAGPATVRVGAADSGATLRLRTADRLEVMLEGNPTTGYTWEVTACDTTVLKPVGEGQFVADGSAPGSAGKVVTGFEAVGQGQTVLEMIYQRTFEKGVPPLRTFELSVRVQGATEPGK